MSAKLFKMLTAAGIGIVMMTGCSSLPHEIASEQRSDQLNKQYQSLTVMAAQTDPASRKIVERQLADDLGQHQVSATPSFESLPDAAKITDEAALQAYADSQANEALLILSVTDAGYDYGYDDYLETRGWVYMLGGEPGAGTQIGSLISWAGSGQQQLHVQVYDKQAKQIVWQADIDANDSGSEVQNIQALTRFVVDQMQARAIIQ
ncbi:hypothetical protein K0I63_18345 [Shewanella rhizosphaerae]|uniref:hypothetical protein n=1 Tax=Shewanella rhizosphaerae TaxID=2864207 RepID=UPI001C6585FD|nr:hypothetical protein [Shewanella rhizosphaerae]QYK12658.1 hypothetical protein K0I63_18345 [Shewanella rhizosphaerae]